MATQADITNTDARDASASPKLTFETYAEYLRNNFLNPLLGSGPTFRAYRRFLAHLEESEGEHHPDSSVSFGFPYLNKFSFSLHRFDESGKSMASHNSKNVNRIEFTHILTHPDCSVTYQVVTLLFGDGYCPSWVVDVLGLQLGVPSHIWVYLFSSRPWARGELNTRTWIGSGERTTTMRIDSNHFIEIDDDALLILEDNAGVRPKTAIMFLGKARDQDEASFINILPWKPPLTRSPDPVICGVRRDAHTQGTFDDMKERTLLHFIKGRGQTPLAYGAGGFLFACLEALLCYHIARGLLGVPWFGKLHESYESKYGYEGRWNTDNIRERWNTIRGQTHYQRAALLSLPDFVHGNFNMKSGALKDAYELIKGKFERHVQKLDLEEARLRDIIDIVSSAKSTRMAELSIKESKRVMMLTMLAFIFLPVSLSGTIFGMNVQQINRTGHDIKAFVITSVAILVVALLAWGASAVLALCRARYRHWRRRDLVRKVKIYGHYRHGSVAQTILDYLCCIWR